MIRLSSSNLLLAFVVQVPSICNNHKMQLMRNILWRVIKGGRDAGVSGFLRASSALWTICLRKHLLEAWQDSLEPPVCPKLGVHSRKLPEDLQDISLSSSEK